MGNFIKKEQKRKVSRKSYVWATLLYPESCNPDFRKLLSDMAVPCLVSPLHDKDINDDGSLKKSHYHIIMKFKTQKSDLQIADIVSSIGGVGCEIVHDVGQYARYLIHLDDPDKAQYDSSNVFVIGDLDYNRLIAPSIQAVDAFVEVIDLIENNGIDTYTELVRLCRKNRPELIKVLMDKSYALNIYLRGIRQSDAKNLKYQQDLQVAKVEQLISDGWTPLSKNESFDIWGKQNEI